MNDQTNSSMLTTGQLIIGLILALIVGVAITVFVILPAETGQDPTGFGETTGLDQLSGSEEAVSVETEQPAAPVLDADTLYIAIDPETVVPEMDEFGVSKPAVSGANLLTYPSPYKTETLEIKLELDARVEYKAILDEGVLLLYSWEADGEVYYDFHAHQAEGNPDFWTRYAEGESTSDNGSIVAPYQGQHGWFWLNLADGPTTIKLTVAGYYDEIIEIDMSGGYTE